MDNFIKTLNRFKNGTKLILQFDCYEIEGSINTIYETNNDVDEGIEEYIEYYACVIEVSKFRKLGNYDVAYRKGELIEISKFNLPEKIYTIDGKQIWNKSTIM